MSRVLGCIPLTNEHMPQMSPACCAKDFRSGAVGIRDALHRSGNLIIETWPATVGIEFILRPVERRIAPPTDVCANHMMVSVFPDERELGPLVDNDAFLFGRELIEFHGER